MQAEQQFGTCLLKRVWLIILHLGVYATLVLVLRTAWVDWLPVAIGAVLIWISVRDIETQEIPDSATALLTVLAAFWIWRNGVALVDPLVAAALWPALFIGVGAAFRHFRGHEGLGFGDVKLMVPIGLLAGLSGSITVVLAAALGGIATMLLFRFSNKSENTPISEFVLPFGPFLCLASWAAFLK